jgi:DNA repair protein RadC
MKNMKETLKQLGFKPDVVSEILERYGHRLGNIGEAELADIPGLGKKGRKRLLAAVDLGKQILMHRDNSDPILCSRNVYERFIHLSLLEKETFWAVTLNAKNRVTMTIKIADGTQLQCLVTPRDVLTPLLREGAFQVILLHNHPSGDSTPSPEDIGMTKRFQSACSLVGIKLLDHVIIGKDCYKSLRDEGLMSDSNMQIQASNSLLEAVSNLSKPDVFIRQQDVLDALKITQSRVTIIGAGAIGSFTALSLAKMGIGHIEVYDHDTVEPHNLPNQWYRMSDVGSTKVNALAEILRAFAGTEVTAHDRPFLGQPVSGIVISAVDSMDTRIRIWRHIRKLRNVQLYLDARMGVETGRVLCVIPADPLSVRAYESELYPSSEALQAPCTAKATIYCAAGLAAFIAAKVGKYLMGRPYRNSLTIDFRQAILI